MLWGKNKFPGALKWGKQNSWLKILAFNLCPYIFYCATHTMEHSMHLWAKGNQVDNIMQDQIWIPYKVWVMSRFWDHHSAKLWSSQLLWKICQADGSRWKRSGGDRLSRSRKAFYFSHCLHLWLSNYLIRLLEWFVSFIASVNKTSCSRRSICLSPRAVAVRDLCKKTPYLSLFSSSAASWNRAKWW